MKSRIFEVIPGTPESVPYQSFLAKELTVGIIGLGNIGTKTGLLAQKIGYNVIAWNRTKKDTSPIMQVSLDELFAQSDIISLHLRTNEETKYFLNETTLSTTKKGVMIVNAGGGKLIDQKALYAAMQSGQVAGAGLDVWTEDEYLHQIAALDTAIVTPCISWFTQDALHNLSNTIVDNILSFVE